MKRWKGESINELRKWRNKLENEFADNEREQKIQVKLKTSHLLQRRRVKASLRQLLLQVDTLPQAGGGGEEGVDESESPHLEAEIRKRN